METHLIEENILSISALHREVLQISILADSVLQAQLLPELATDCRGSCQHMETVSYAMRLESRIHVGETTNAELRGWSSLGITYRCCRTGRLGL